MELGYAVVDEVIYTTLKANRIDPLTETDDPITTIQQILMLSGDQMTEIEVRYGYPLNISCPLNNLAQEMSPIDKGFQKRITAVYEEWHHAVEEACERGKAAGNLRDDADSKQQSVLFVATLAGCFGLAKSP
jgi:hypothetical protein